MSWLEWQVQYSVGDPKLDQQHAHLFELANTLAKHIAEPEVVAETIKRLHRYVEAHFAYEEMQMENAKYEHLKEHRNMHTLMRTRLDLLTAQLKAGQFNRHELLAFMESWLTEHILTEDMRYIHSVARISR